MSRSPDTTFSLLCKFYWVMLVQFENNGLADVSQSLWIEENALFVVNSKAPVRVKLTAWHFQVSKAEDKPLTGGKWHFISSVSFFLQLCILSFSHSPRSLCPHRPPWILISYFHWLLSKDTGYEITEGLRWSDEDRVSGGPTLGPAGRPVQIIWVNLGLKRSLFCWWPDIRPLIRMLWGVCTDRY